MYGNDNPVRFIDPDGMAARTSLVGSNGSSERISDYHTMHYYNEYQNTQTGAVRYEEITEEEYNKSTVNVEDPFGPSTKEALGLAKYVYGGKGATKENLGPYSISHQAEGITLTDPTSGLKSMLFEKTEDGVTSYVLAFAGTDTNSKERGPDVKNDVKQLYGTSRQYQEAVEVAQKIYSAVGEANITYVGHSLGGGLATAAAFATNSDAITFNPAWLSKATMANLGLHGNDFSITNHIIFGEQLDQIQRTSGFALGLVHYGTDIYQTNAKAFIPIVGPALAHSISSF